MSTFRLLTAFVAVSCLAFTVSGCGPRTTEEALRTLATNASGSERTHAAEFIAKSLDASAAAQAAALVASDPTADPYIEQMALKLKEDLHDKNPDRQVAAAKCLAALGARGLPAVLSRVEGLMPTPEFLKGSQEEKIAQSARVAGASWVPGLLDELEGRRNYLWAEVLLGEIGEPAVDPLMRLAASEDANVRSSAARALVLIERNVPGTVKKLVPLLLQDLGGEKSWVAQNLLSEIGEPAVDPLVSLLGKSKDADVRTDAADVLARIGGPTVDPLIRLLREGKTGDTRFAAAEVLAQIELNAPGTVKKLTSALDSKDLKSIAKDYRFYIKLGRPGSEPLLRSALMKYGGKSMALDYLNCGNGPLDEAGRAWAKKNGYRVNSRPGSYAGPKWGEGV